MSDAFDLTVIGTGPGGYVCAIRAAQLGMKVAVVEKRATHGGTCLNVGCIPSKALLHATELFEEAGHDFAKLGIVVGQPKLDLVAMMEHKKEVVDGNVIGIDYLFKKNKITAFHGVGRITGAGSVEVTAPDGSLSQIASKNIVIATGSDAMSLPGVDIDEKQIVSSTGALEFDEVPGTMIVVGAGVVGLEMGSIWRRLGTRVTVVEYQDRILPGMDGETAKLFLRILKRQGIGFMLSSKVDAIEKNDTGLAVSVQPAVGDAEGQMLEADVVLIAIGRRPSTDGLGLEEAGIAVDDRGRVRTDSRLQTNIEGIYAIGDVIDGPMLAHKAEDEGVALAETLAGQAGHVNYDVIPGVVYTMPEVASVGRTEEDLKQAGVSYAVGKFPFTANGRAKSILKTSGQVKVLADAKTDRVLGVHIIGAGASEIIHEAAILMEFGGSAEDLARTCHAHPTLSEAVKEAALAVDKRAIHM